MTWEPKNKLDDEDVDVSDDDDKDDDKGIFISIMIRKLALSITNPIFSSK